MIGAAVGVASIVGLPFEATLLVVSLRYRRQGHDRGLRVCLRAGDGLSRMPVGPDSLHGVAAAVGAAGLVLTLTLTAIVTTGRAVSPRRLDSG
jgi:hypothetical protein